MLHYHLNKKRLHEGSDSDNLTSWTSSLLFGIQYAIYRCHIFKLSYSDVNIYMVDPRDFPHGQFIKDKILIEVYRGSADAESEADHFFDFRMNRHEYDNREYLC